MNGHPQFDEDFDLYLLGTLEGEDRQAFESHLRRCTKCGAKLEGAAGRVALLALAAPVESAPAAIKERLMRRVHKEVRETQRASAPTFLRWLAPALAVLALVLSIVTLQMRMENRALHQRQVELLADARRLQNEVDRERLVLDLLTSSDTVKVTLVAGAAHPAPEGKAFYHPHKGLLFYASNLPVLPSTRTYQLWLVPTQGNPISAGVFRVDASGNGQIFLPSLPAGVAAKAFAVTLEPAGGVPQPTGPKVLIGLVS